MELREEKWDIVEENVGEKRKRNIKGHEERNQKNERHEEKNQKNERNMEDQLLISIGGCVTNNVCITNLDTLSKGKYVVSKHYNVQELSLIHI